MVTIFLFLFGALAIVGAVLTVLWAKITWRRRLVITWPWYHDRYFILAGSLATLSTGLTATSMGRLLGTLSHGTSPILQRDEVALIGPGMVAMIAGSLGIIWLVDIERSPITWGWSKAMSLLIVLWAVASLFLAPLVPIR